MFISKEENKARLAHNENLYTIPEELTTGKLYGDRVIVKRLAFATPETEEKDPKQRGIEEPRFEVPSLDSGGLVKVRISDEKYAPMGVVMEVGDHEYAQKYNVGDLVKLDHKALARNHYDYLLDPENPVSKPNGLVLIPSSLIERVLKLAENEPEGLLTSQ